MRSGLRCAPTAGFRLVRQCPRRVGECFGTTPLRRGTRCSKQAGDCAHHQFGDSELSWVRGGSCNLKVDLPADVHPRPQSKVHTIRAIDEFLKLLRCDSFADFPDAKGRAFRAGRETPLAWPASTSATAPIATAGPSLPAISEASN